MSLKPEGNIRGLAPKQLRAIEKLFRRNLYPEDLVTNALGREISQVAKETGRMIGLLIGRDGEVERVIVGTREILYLPDLGRYRLGAGRLRRLRLVFSDLSKSDEVHLPSDIITDLEKLRLDAVVAVKETSSGMSMSYGYLKPITDPNESPTTIESVLQFRDGSIEFGKLIESIEDQLERSSKGVKPPPNSAVVIGVYSKRDQGWKESNDELVELARTAGVTIVNTVIQRREPDPRTVIGKGKLEEVILLCLRLEAEIILFDGELKPFQWRVITNATELKVLDRSMLILDIFARRARSSDGRLQVELAQLKYNLPRLVEKDVGLSRLTGGIGGRGPGETKLEISRRRARDRIRDLEKQIEKLRNQRALRRKKRQGIPIPLVAIIGYTNAGKSTLFNEFTNNDVLAENKLFATLEPAQGRYLLPPQSDDPTDYGTPIVFTDTVGFIRDLPAELRNAFRATLEELYEANLLLHVVDASSPYAEEQVTAVEAVLEEMELLDAPRLIVWNKADLIDQERRAELNSLRKGVFTSAIERAGFEELRNQLQQLVVVPKRSTYG